MVGDLVIRHVLGQSIAAQEQHGITSYFKARYDRRASAPPSALVNMWLNREVPIWVRQCAHVNEFLRHRLVFRDLTQPATTEMVATAVSDLHDIRPRPGDDGEGQRGRHALNVGVIGSVGEDLLVRAECRVAKGVTNVSSDVVPTA